MLARRAIPRSHLHFRRNVLTPTKRSFSYSPPPIYSPRGSGIYAKFRYRKDGSPRSLLKGAAIGSISIFTGLMLLVFAQVSEEVEMANMALRRLVYIHRMDTEYGSLDTSDFEDTVNFFVEVCSLCLQDEEESQEPLKAFAILAKDLDGPQLEDFHKVLRSALETVHQMLSDSREKDPLQTAYDTLECLDSALRSGLAILVEYHGSEDDSIMKLAKAHTAGNMVPPKEVVEKSEIYQIVG
ncbi:hypothetical protein H0H92_008131 [Tricholoma furcatifolium]|nr:hypothetical protein H0H92_008131 [Tricholoma furcatifolium]